MGTNYYLRYKQPVACPHCGHAETISDLHIGKRSAGWRFSFHGIKDKELESWEEWLQFLRRELFGTPGAEIVDEYGKEVPIQDLIAIVESTKHLKSHALLYPQGCWSDDEGHSFDGGEFS